jgi:site-specific DNA recombinase
MPRIFSAIPDTRTGPEWSDRKGGHDQWREEQNCCQREIERHQQADQSYMDEGVQLLELAQNAQRLFAKQAPHEKRRLLNFVLSNCTWEDGRVVTPSASRLICWRKPP